MAQARQALACLIYLARQEPTPGRWAQVAALHTTFFQVSRQLMVDGAAPGGTTPPLPLLEDQLIDCLTAWSCHSAPALQWLCETVIREQAAQRAAEQPRRRLVRANRETPAE